MVDVTVAFERRDFYVYVIFRPNGVPCYVGKGRGQRFRAHFWKSTNSHLARIIRKNGSELPVVKIHEDLTNKQACDYEVALIRAIGRRKNSGPLANSTDGGEGSVGLVQSAETIAKRVAKLRGRKRSPELCARIGRAISIGKRAKPAKNNKWSEERRAKASARLKGAPLSAAALAASAALRAGKPLSEGHREKISATLRSVVRGPEFGAAISAGKKGKKLSQEYAEQCRRRQTGRKLSPETRARMTEAQKLRWEERRKSGLGHSNQ